MPLVSKPCLETTGKSNFNRVFAFKPSSGHGDEEVKEGEAQDVAVQFKSTLTASRLSVLRHSAMAAVKPLLPEYFKRGDMEVRLSTPPLPP